MPINGIKLKEGFEIKDKNIKNKRINFLNFFEDEFKKDLPNCFLEPDYYKYFKNYFINKNFEQKEPVSPFEFVINVFTSLSLFEKAGCEFYDEYEKDGCLDIENQSIFLAEFAFIVSDNESFDFCCGVSACGTNFISKNYDLDDFKIKMSRYIHTK